MTSLALREYFLSGQTLAYVPRNLSLVLRYDYLPGVFTKNALDPKTNSSLWSLFYEVACYGGVVAVGYLGWLRANAGFVAFFLTVLFGHVLSVLYAPAGGLLYRLDVLGFVAFPFALGMAAYVYRERLRLGLAGVAACWATVAMLSASAFFASAIMLALVYTALWAAFVPKGALLTYNRLGDYSYGIYIFAYPVQQTLVALWPDMSVAQNIAGAAPITLALAVASWNWIEKPALDMARPAGDRLDRMLRRFSGRLPAGQPGSADVH